MSTTLYYHFWDAVWLGAPLVLLLCLAAGIAKRGRIARWLLVCAAIAVALYLSDWLVSLFRGWQHGGATIGWWYLIPAWLALALAVLVTAVLTAGRGWPLRRLASLLGVMMPLPLMIPFGLWLLSGRI